MNEDARSLDRDWAKIPTLRDLARKLREVLVIWECARYDLESEWAATHLRRKRNAIGIASEFLDRVEFGGTLSAAQVDLALKLHRRAKAKKGRRLRERTAKQEDSEEGEPVEHDRPGVRASKNREIDLVQQCAEGAIPGD